MSNNTIGRPPAPMQQNPPKTTQSGPAAPNGAAPNVKSEGVAPPQTLNPRLQKALENFGPEERAQALSVLQAYGDAGVNIG